MSVFRDEKWAREKGTNNRAFSIIFFHKCDWTLTLSLCPILSFHLIQPLKDKIIFFCYIVIVFFLTIFCKNISPTRKSASKGAPSKRHRKCSSSTFFFVAGHVVGISCFLHFINSQNVWLKCSLPIYHRAQKHLLGQTEEKIVCESESESKSVKRWRSREDGYLPGMRECREKLINGQIIVALSQHACGFSGSRTRRSTQAVSQADIPWGILSTKE